MWGILGIWRDIVAFDQCELDPPAWATDGPFESFQSNAASVVFSIGSPTIVPSSRSTNAWAAARVKVVSLLVSVTGMRRLGSLELWARISGVNIGLLTRLTQHRQYPQPLDPRR